jgi:hypothetical protein
MYNITIRMIMSRRVRWAVHVARYGEKRNVYRILVGKPEMNKLLGTPRCRWMNNIKMDRRSYHEVVLTGLMWLKIGSGGPCAHGNEYSGSIKSC